MRAVAPVAPVAPAELAPALARMADLLAWPLMLIDEHGALRHANRAARHLLRAGKPLRLLPNQQLQPAAAAWRAEFAGALEAAALGQPGVLRWPGRRLGFQGTLQALNELNDLNNLNRPAGRGARTTLLLLALAPASGFTPDLAAYGAAHGLTAAEQRVLSLLARGRNAAQAAADAGVAVSTARSHIASLRRKTGHTSVAALLLDLNRLPPVLGFARRR